MHVCTEEGRDFRNNYYKSLIQTDIYVHAVVLSDVSVVVAVTPLHLFLIPQ